MKTQTWLASRLVYQESDMLVFMISLSPILPKLDFGAAATSYALVVRQHDLIIAQLT
jgi:hypothetical protein